MDKKSIILEGKNLEALINQGLEKLNKKREEVNVEIQEEKKSLFGIKKHKYKVKISVLDSDEIKQVNHDNLNNVYIENMYGYYELSYREDGVYLAVYEGIKEPQVTEKEVFSRLVRKGIIDYDLECVSQIVSERKGEFVKIAPSQEEKLINAELNIEISNDKMVCFATLIPPDGGQDLSMEDALRQVTSHIKYGLINEELENLINEKVYNKKIVIAKGREPIDGKDGYIKYYFNTEKKLTLDVLDDGRVDYRNLHLIDNVKKGDLIAELVPSEEGKPGITVTGEKIAQKNGKDVVLKYGKNVSISEDGTKLYSTVDGQVYLEDDKVVVQEIYEVPADVDNSTGNINFNGNVRVRGNVRMGFEISALGDIEVLGVVEGAKLESSGNIILKRGIQGHHKGELKAKGDIVARYIENSSIKCEGDINAEAIMHSEVSSGGNIKVLGKKGLIVGGVCKATSEIHAKIIGSMMETSTVLEVGVDPELKNRCESLKEHLRDINDNIEKLNKSISLINRLAKTDNLTDDKKQLLTKLISTKKLLDTKAEDINKEIADLERQIEMLSSGRVIAENVIYPGVKIVIGNSQMFVKKEMSNCIIYREQGEIRTAPYK